MLIIIQPLGFLGFYLKWKQKVKTIRGRLIPINGIGCDSSLHQSLHIKVRVILYSKYISNVNQKGHLNYSEYHIRIEPMF